MDGWTGTTGLHEQICQVFNLSTYQLFAKWQLVNSRNERGHSAPTSHSPFLHCTALRFVWSNNRRETPALAQIQLRGMPHWLLSGVAFPFFVHHCFMLPTVISLSPKSKESHRFILSHSFYFTDTCDLQLQPWKLFGRQMRQKKEKSKNIFHNTKSGEIGINITMSNCRWLEKRMKRYKSIAGAL